jgi:hypothetical protein
MAEVRCLRRVDGWQGVISMRKCNLGRKSDTKIVCAKMDETSSAVEDSSEFSASYV